MLIEISEVKLAMESIRGQIWTDLRPEAIFLSVDPTNLSCVLIEISEVKLAMESISGQIWTDWRPEAIFLSVDLTDLAFGMQGTFVC